MVKFSVRPSYTYVNELPSWIDHHIGDVCSDFDPSARFTKAYQKGYYDGKYKLFDKRQRRFPTGLLPQVVARLQENDVDWEIEETRFEMKKPSLSVPDGVELRDYQEETCLKLLEVGRGIGEVGTGGGKSYISAALVNSFKPYKTIVFASRNRGVHQLLELFSELFGEENLSDETDTDRWITVMTYSKATKRDLWDYQLVVADEVQKTAASTFFPAVMRCKKAYHRFGLSGTPEGRTDNKDIYIYGATGEVIHEVSQKKLQEKGYTSETEAYMVKVEGDIYFDTNDWHILEPSGIGRYELRNDKVVEIVSEADKRDKATLIMVRLIDDHGKVLLERLREEGFDVEFTHGRQSEEEKMKLYKSFKEGDLDILIASGIFEDSIDIDRIDVLINAVGGKSAIATKQRLGRGLRKREDKTLLFFDFTDDHYYKLKEHASLRKRYYEEEGLDVQLVDSVNECFDD